MEILKAEVILMDKGEKRQTFIKSELLLICHHGKLNNDDCPSRY